jgi:hypothetical protein
MPRHCAALHSARQYCRSEAYIDHYYAAQALAIAGKELLFPVTWRKRRPPLAKK